MEGDRASGHGSRRRLRVPGPTVQVALGCGTGHHRHPLERPRVLRAQEPAGTAMKKAVIDSTLVKALARAHRWKHLIESGKYGSVGELAASEKINESYVCRVLRLTLLAPDIVEAILDGRQNKAWQLEQMLVPFPMEWSAQRGDWNGGNG